MDDSISENARGKRQRSDSSDQDLMANFDDIHRIPGDREGDDEDDDEDEDDGDFGGDDDDDDDDDGMEFILDNMPGLTLDPNEARCAAEHNPRGVTILLRACLNDTFVTPVYHIPAHHVRKMWRVTR